MNFSLVISTFVMIFLAELGDKTQLAAMAASAGSKQPLAVLLGASVALVLSSVCAVVAGTFIGEKIPLKFIKIAAGIMFILFGLLYVKEAFVPEKAEELTKVAPLDMIGGSLIKVARAFEEQELKMLEAVRESIQSELCRDKLEEIIRQERNHLIVLGNVADDKLIFSSAEKNAFAPLKADYVCRGDDECLIADMYEREQAMADFYRIMAEKSAIVSVKNAFYRLSQEELAHAVAIREILV